MHRNAQFLAEMPQSFYLVVLPEVEAESRFRSFENQTRALNVNATVIAYRDTACVQLRTAGINMG
jgi:hypothetical protein